MEFLATKKVLKKKKKKERKIIIFIALDAVDEITSRNPFFFSIFKVKFKDAEDSYIVP